ncbi:hypothetical protein [Delftia sp. UME58]|uniref:hypothetical protein n=1 Tax=Delftia sp. UME58 TaxID=1862322 RepID=UPI001602BE6D|nr:hypothetical protein [Delftia sp. UME58]MBB1649758.1 hypothetical protein [Delftia sp. UME58]
MVPVGPPQRFACVAAPSYLALRGTPRTPRELPGHACIGRRFPSVHCYAWEFHVNGEPLAVEVNGPLVAVLGDCAAPPGRFCLYYSRRRHLPAALRALVDFLRA